MPSSLVYRSLVPAYAWSSLDPRPSDLCIPMEGIFRLVVQKSRQDLAHARTFGGDFELKILRVCGFSS